jgi:DNA-binding MarR family transcriptional regulator
VAAHPAAVGGAHQRRRDAAAGDAAAAALAPRGQLAGRHLPAHSNNRVGGDWSDGFRTADDVTVPAIGDTDSTRPRRDRTTDLPVGSTLVLYTDGWPGRSPGCSTCRPTPSSTACSTRSATTARTTPPPLAIRVEGQFRRAGAGSLTSTVPHVAQRWLDEEQQRIWRTWLSVAELLPRVLDAQLQRDAGLSHAAYVVLAMLSEAPGRSRRMSDLARRANQSQSRLSHTVARLEERGWVRREPSPEDGRGNVAVLTDAGWEVVRSVAPGHAEAVRSALFDPLTDEQTRGLGNALQAVLDRLDPDHSLRLQESADAG